jgi:hypothetical protein
VRGIFPLVGRGLGVRRRGRLDDIYGVSLGILLSFYFSLYFSGTYPFVAYDFLYDFLMYIR